MTVRLFVATHSFSADGDFMFSIQSGKKGATHLIKYVLFRATVPLFVRQMR
jgi:hypothetical protein